MAENNRYTFILWNVASSYQSWVTASLDGKASQKDPIVVLHAAEEVVPALNPACRGKGRY